MVAATITACADDGTASSTTAVEESPVDRYCAVVADATERGSEETMALLHDAALPEVADLLDRLARYESSTDDFVALGTFNEAMCGVHWP